MKHEGCVIRSSNITYLPQLDHLRLFAAMLIVVFHLANGPFVHSMHFDIGVPLFFTLSGYLFFTIAANKESEEILYWKFLYNRILRIYPLVILLFLMTAVVMDTFTAIDFINLIGLNFPGKMRESWVIGDWGYQYISFNWWTIGVEFTFYLLFPFLFKFYKSFGLKFLINLLLLVILFKFLLYYTLLTEHGWKKLAISFNYSFFGNFDIFIIGMIIAVIARRLSNNSYLKSLLSSRIFFIGYILFMWEILIKFLDEIPIPLSTVLTASLCGILIVSYSFSFCNIKNKFLSNFLSSIGSLSFSIYLLHDFIKNGFKGMGLEDILLNFLVYFNYNSVYNEYIILIFYIPMILIISKITFHTIELPFLNMRVNYFKKI